MAKDRQTQALVKVDEAAIARLEDADAKLVAARDTGQLQTWSGTFAMTAAMQGMRDALQAQGVLDNIMRLQGSPVGFLTDKDKTGGYDVATVADVTITARMHGAFMANNEVNIIGGRCFLAQNCYDRKVRELRGSDVLQSLDIDYGIPHGKDGGAVTEVTVTYKRPSDPQPTVKVLNIPVRVNAGQGTDAILGKVKRRVDKWIVDTITAQNTPGGDIGDEPVTGPARPRVDRTQAVDVEQVTKAPADTAPPAGREATDGPADIPSTGDVCDALELSRDQALKFFRTYDNISQYYVSRSIKELSNAVRREIVCDAAAWAERAAEWLRGSADA